MPFTYGSRTRRRKAATKRASRRASAARFAVAKARRRAFTSNVRRVIARTKESKDSHSAVSDGNLVSTAGSFHGNFFDMGQGGGVWARQGDYIQPTKITIRFSWGMSEATNLTRDDYNYVRMMVCQLKVPQAEANLADFPDVWKLPSDDFRRKYRVLHDHREVLNAKDSGAGSGATLAYRKPIRTINIYGKRLQKAQWSGVGPGASQPNVKGGFVLYTVSDSGAVAHPTFSYQIDQYAKDDD